jgi:hypothetical protein
MRHRLLLEPLSEIGKINGGEGAGTIAATQRKDQMIERSDCLKSVGEAGKVGRIHDGSRDIAIQASHGCLQLRRIATCDRDTISFLEKMGSRRKADAG